MRFLIALFLTAVCAAPADYDIHIGRFQHGIASRHSFQPKEVMNGQQDVTPLFKYLGMPAITYNAQELINFGKITTSTRTAERNLATVTVAKNKLPYSSTYWPMVDGGIDGRWHSANEQSPLEKYCSLYLNNDKIKMNQTREWVYKNQGPGVPGVADWFGICQGWAGSGVAEMPPHRDVWVRSIKRAGTHQPSQQYLTVECTPQQVATANVTGCVHMLTGDITGLISESYASGDSVFIGQRCDVDQKDFVLDQFGRVSVNVTSGRTRTVSTTKCRSNPATLFLTATNFIGKAQTGFVINCVNNNEVWNQAAYAYRILSYRNITFEQGTYLVDENETLNQTTIINTTTWRFNPAAKSLKQVRMTLLWAVETASPPVGIPTLRTAQGDYDFILELNANGTVIGGEWLYDSKLDHPPFYWVPIEPARDGDSGIPPNFHYGNVKQILQISQSLIPTYEATANFTSTTPYPDACNEFFTCSTCITGSVCGWCQTTATCLSGVALKSNNGICNRTAAGGTWQWEASQCASMTPAPPAPRTIVTEAPTTLPPTREVICARETTCGGCTLIDNCGWCRTTGRCQVGLQTGSNDKICTARDVTWAWLSSDCNATPRPTTASPVVTAAPTNAPTVAPTAAVTAAPTDTATVAPTEAATAAPTDAATVAPTAAATVAPTDAATVAPTEATTVAPTDAATVAPVVNTTTDAPTDAATVAPVLTASTADITPVFTASTGTAN